MPRAVVGTCRQHRLGYTEYIFASRCRRDMQTTPPWLYRVYICLALSSGHADNAALVIQSIYLPVFRTCRERCLGYTEYIFACRQDMQTTPPWLYRVYICLSSGHADNPALVIQSIYLPVVRTCRQPRLGYTEYIIACRQDMQTTPPWLYRVYICLALSSGHADNAAPFLHLLHEGLERERD